MSDEVRWIVDTSVLSEDQKLDILDKRREDFSRAVTNLITGITPKEDFPGGVIPVRPIRGGAKTRYVPGWWFIKQLNALFGHFWDFEVITQEVGKEQLWVRGTLTVNIPGKTVIERRQDGSTYEVHYDPITIRKTQYGGSDVKKLREGGAVMDIADDLKSAATDCMKKCATLIGLASDIYGAKENVSETAANGKQLEILYRVANEVGLTDIDMVNSYSLVEFGKTAKDLEQLEALDLIAKCRKAKAKGETISIDTSVLKTLDIPVEEQ